MQDTYNLITCGGTFDFLHAGHKEFLRFVFSLGKKVLIGLTSDEFISGKKQVQQVRSYSERKQVLETFLQNENLFHRTIIIPIDTKFGPTLERDSGIDALAVTEETEKNAMMINQERQKLHLPKLPVHVMPMVKNNDIMISSTNIRKGIIDPEGNMQTLSLPQELRSVLHKPFGQVIGNGIAKIKKLNQDMIVTVGDITTARFNKEHIEQKISVIDYVVERKKTFEKITDLGFTGNETIVSLKNPAGEIAAEAWRMIFDIVKKIEEKKRFIITVTGEEDLLVIPLILILPLGFYIFYGQPHEGVVKVQVTRASKKRVQKLIRQFHTTGS